MVPEITACGNIVAYNSTFNDAIMKSGAAKCQLPEQGLQMTGKSIVD